VIRGFPPIDLLPRCCPWDAIYGGGSAGARLRSSHRDITITALPQSALLPRRGPSLPSPSTEHRAFCARKIQSQQPAPPPLITLRAMIFNVGPHLNVTLLSIFDHSR
jgi:hypothetical protein